jgi:hypothetical protein
MKSVEDNPTYKVKSTEFNSIVRSYFLILKDLLFKGEIFKMPYNTGILQILRYKPKSNKVPINWKATQLYKKIIREFNKHSNGFVYRCIWDTGAVKLKALRMYKFKSARQFSRDMSTIVKDGNTEFYEYYQK